MHPSVLFNYIDSVTQASHLLGTRANVQNRHPAWQLLELQKADWHELGHESTRTLSSATFIDSAVANVYCSSMLRHCHLSLLKHWKQSAFLSMLLITTVFTIIGSNSCQ